MVVKVAKQNFHKTTFRTFLLNSSSQLPKEFIEIDPQGNYGWKTKRQCVKSGELNIGLLLDFTYNNSY